MFCLVLREQYARPKIVLETVFVSGPNSLRCVHVPQDLSVFVVKLATFYFIQSKTKLQSRYAIRLSVVRDKESAWVLSSLTLVCAILEERAHSASSRIFLARPLLALFKLLSVHIRCIIKLDVFHFKDLLSL